MDAFVELFGEVQVIPILDSNSGYWQIEMDEENVDKTAFATNYGLLRYL